MLELILTILRTMAGYEYEWKGDSGTLYMHFKLNPIDARKFIVAVLRLVQPSKWSVEYTGIHCWIYRNGDYLKPSIYRLDSNNSYRFTPQWKVGINDNISITIDFK